MATQYPGAPESQTFKPQATPAASQAAPAPKFSGVDATINVEAPKALKFGGFQRNEKFADAAKAFKPSDKSMVSNQVTGLLSKPSDYLKVAQGNAMRYGNSRNLLNSSITAGAGAKAAIDAVLPIAQADASMYGNVDLARQGFLSNSALSEQGAYNQSRASAQDATQTSGLSRQATQADIAKANQAANQQSILEAQDATQRAKMAQQQGDINLTSQYDAAQYGQAASAQGATQQSGLTAQQQAGTHS